MGWMSLPWRHWIYIIGTLFFGLLFVTLAPVAFLVRVLVLLIPFLIALGLAVPYGGLHMDEWILLAVKYRMRPTAGTISHEELKGQAFDNLEELLDIPLEAIADTPAGASWLGEQPVAEGHQQDPGVWIPGTRDAVPEVTATHQIYLAGTHGILRRSAGVSPFALPPEGTPLEPPAPTDAAWQFGARQPGDLPSSLFGQRSSQPGPKKSKKRRQ